MPRWRSEGVLQESVPPFHCVCHRCQTQVARVGSQHLHPLSCFAGLPANLLLTIGSVHLGFGGVEAEQTEN